MTKEMPTCLTALCNDKHGKLTDWRREEKYTLQLMK